MDNPSPTLSHAQPLVTYQRRYLSNPNNNHLTILHVSPCMDQQTSPTHHPQPTLLNFFNQARDLNQCLWKPQRPVSAVVQLKPDQKELEKLQVEGLVGLHASEFEFEATNDQYATVHKKPPDRALAVRKQRKKYGSLRIPYSVVSIQARSGGSPNSSMVCSFPDDEHGDQHIVNSNEAEGYQCPGLMAHWQDWEEFYLPVNATPLDRAGVVIQQPLPNLNMKIVHWNVRGLQRMSSFLIHGRLFICTSLLF